MLFPPKPGFLVQKKVELPPVRLKVIQTVGHFVVIVSSGVGIYELGLKVIKGSKTAKKKRLPSGSEILKMKSNKTDWETSR